MKVNNVPGASLVCRRRVLAVESSSECATKINPFQEPKTCGNHGTGKVREGGKIPGGESERRNRIGQ